MAKLDYDALRAQTMGAGNDEAVTVNTRALIDKVLARYSGEWTTLRELLQNAADASASKVIIKFETSPSPTVPVPSSLDSSARLKHVLLHHTLKSTIVENNGEVFKITDWSRLKKIAEGNPDETKIGAFGVGFYSGTHRIRGVDLRFIVLGGGRDLFRLPRQNFLTPEPSSKSVD